MTRTILDAYSAALFEKFPAYVQDWIRAEGIVYVTPGLLEDEAEKWRENGRLCRQSNPALAALSYQRAASLDSAAVILRVKADRPMPTSGTANSERP